MSSSPYRVSIRSEDAQRGKISQRWVRDVVRRALAEDRAPDGSRVEVLIAGDETVSALNMEFLGQDGTTDVLSFPSETRGLRMMTTGPTPVMILATTSAR